MESVGLILRTLLILTVLFAASTLSVRAEVTYSDAIGQGFRAVEKAVVTDFFGQQVAEVVSGTKKDKKRKTAKNKTAKNKTFKKRTTFKKRKTFKNEGESKIGELPPGLQKHIYKHGTLPPGLQKHIYKHGTLPPGLAKLLGPTEAGLERLIVDDDVVLVEAATGRVVDIIKDVVRDRDK